MEQDNHSFIIRIWDASSTQGNLLEKTWRGSIDYVGSGKRLYFNDLNSIANFIREQIHSDDPQAVARWEALVDRSRVSRRIQAAWLLLFQRLLGLLHGSRRRTVPRKD